MPIQECSIENKPGYQWGETGKCYTYEPGNEESRKEAKRKAYIQGYAMGELNEMETEEIGGNNLSELAEILNVPIITTGVFQGHKGPPVKIDTEKFQKMLKGSNRFQPYLKEAMQTGVMPGNSDFFERLQKPMPAPITLNHEVLEDDKVKESLKDIQVEFSEELIVDEQNPNGKPWIVEKFSGVNPLAADIIRRFFPKRSAEILELDDPETGERLPVIISTAFLSNKEIRPAVPGQSDNVLVEFSDWNEAHYVITIDEPLLTQGVNTMADKPKKDESVDVSELQKVQETLAAQTQLLTELQAETAQAKKEREQAVELAKQQEAENQKIRNEVVELRSENFVKELSRLRKKDGKTFQAKPAFLDIVKPIIEGNGVIELADGQSQQEAMFKLFDEIAEIGDVTLQLSLEGEKPYSQPEQKPDKGAMIQELMEKEKLSENEAWIKATNLLGEYKSEV